MTTRDAIDWCDCGKDVPILWAGTCTKCGRQYMFPQGRPQGAAPLTDKRCRQILEETLEEEKRYGYRGMERRDWAEKCWYKLLDAGYLSVDKGFFLLGAGVFCGPRLSGLSTMFFKKERAAKHWQKLKYANVLYDIYVCEKL